MMDCRGMELNEIPTNCPVEVTTLLLQNNYINSLPEHAFSGCSHLKYLNLEYNEISLVHADSLKGLSSLLELSLDHNDIIFSAEHEHLFSDLHSLEVLKISDNNWLNTTKYPQIDHLSGLIELNIDAHESNIPLAITEHTSLPKLEKVSIYGGLKQVTNTTLSYFSGLNVKELRLLSGLLVSLEPMAFGHFANLHLLDLSYNSMLGFQGASQAWYGLRFTKIETLILHRTAPYDHKIVTLDQTFYYGLENTSLTSLILDANNIIILDPRFTTYTPKLTHLSMKYNRLMQVWFLLLDVSNLKYLKTFDARYQTRRLVDDDGYTDWAPSTQSMRRKKRSAESPEEKCFKLLAQLNSKHNASVSLPIPNNAPVCFRLPDSLEELYLSGSLSEDYATIGEVVFLGDARNLMEFQYAENGIERLEGPLIFYSSNEKATLKFDISRNNINFISDIFFDSIGEFLLECNFHSNRLGELFLRNNNNVFRNLDGVKKMNLELNLIKNLHTDVLTHLNHLEVLLLGQNSLRSITFDIAKMENLSELNISSNLLTQLNSHERQTLDMMNQRKNISIDLNQNPLQCSCDTLGFLRWILVTEVEVSGWETYTCMYNEEIVKLELLENTIFEELRSRCNNKLWIIVTSVSAAVVAIVIAISIIVYRHRWDIRYAFLKLSRRKLRGSYERYLDEQLPYDAFIAYDKHDVNFVKQYLIPQLEIEDSEDSALKLMVHHRDFELGAAIQDNIIKAIEESRKTVLVLSSSFLKSKWCNYEVEIASMKCFETGRNLIVCVVLGHLPKSKMSRILHSLLRKNTYLELPKDPAGLPVFWQRLRMALATPATMCTHCPCGRVLEQMQMDTRSTESYANAAYACQH